MRGDMLCFVSVVAVLSWPCEALSTVQRVARGSLRGLPGETDEPAPVGQASSSQLDGTWRTEDYEGEDRGDPSQVDQNPAEPCDCAHCVGMLFTADSRPGFKGFQCKPNDEGLARGGCVQQGDASEWVVQNTPELTYERFCLFTCKPLLPKKIVPQATCGPLTAWERKLEAQTVSGNGREFIFRANPMTDTAPWPALPSEFSEQQADPLDLMEEALAVFPASKEEEAVPPAAPKGEPECDCNCQDDALLSTTLPYPVPVPTPPPGPPLAPPPPVPPPVPLPPPPGPASAPPLPMLPLMMPLPEDLPTLEPTPAPTMQPTAPPPALPAVLPEDPAVAAARAAAAARAFPTHPPSWYQGPPWFPPTAPPCLRPDGSLQLGAPLPPPQPAWPPPLGQQPAQPWSQPQPQPVAPQQPCLPQAAAPQTGPPPAWLQQPLLAPQAADLPALLAQGPAGLELAASPQQLPAQSFPEVQAWGLAFLELRRPMRFRRAQQKVGQVRPAAARLDCDCKAQCARRAAPASAQEEAQRNFRLLRLRGGAAGTGLGSDAAD